VCKASRVAVQQAGTVVTVVIVMVVPPRPPYHIFWLTVAVVLEEGRVLEYGPRLALAADPTSRFAGLLRAATEEIAP